LKIQAQQLREQREDAREVRKQNHVADRDAFKQQLEDISPQDKLKAIIERLEVLKQKKNDRINILEAKLDDLSDDGSDDVEDNDSADDNDDSLEHAGSMAAADQHSR